MASVPNRKRRSSWTNIDETWVGYKKVINRAALQLRSGLSGRILYIVQISQEYNNAGQ